MSVEMAREIARLREALAHTIQERNEYQSCWHAMWKERDEARAVAQSALYCARYGISPDPTQYERRFDWLNEPRATPPPDAPSAPEDVNRITGEPLLLPTPTERLTALECRLQSAIWEAISLKARVTALEAKNIPYTLECIFERLRRLEARPYPGPPGMGVGHVIHPKPHYGEEV